MNERLTLSVITCDHSRDYLSELIASIPEIFDIEVFYQGNFSMRKHYDRVSRIVQTERLFFEDPTCHRDAQFHYSQALRYSKDKILLEDDIILSKNFGILLQQIVSMLLKDGPELQYITTLYTPYLPPSYELRLIAGCQDVFYGMLCMIYDPSTALLFSDYLCSRLGVEPHDLAVRSFIYDVPSVVLLSSSLSLVQHAGVVSTGLEIMNEVPRIARNFIDSFIVD